MKIKLLPFLLIILISSSSLAQNLLDDFEGNGTIKNWVGDDCEINTSKSNPYKFEINTSETVMEYNDKGGTYANVRFDIDNNFDLRINHTFKLKIYVPASGLSGNQANQISLKLQNNMLTEPWGTQTEIIKSLVLDQWQTITFNFKDDNYINLNGSSLPPVQRTDLNRVVIQINGENNADKVVAYIDDFDYDGTVLVDPVFERLVWSDEFETDGAINSNKWFHQTQLPAGGSWFNGEIQHYTNRTDNAYVDDGMLHIVAKKEEFSDQGHTKSYTSARLNSKYAFTYGKVEVRAKLPEGAGTWPAIWMLGRNINEDGGYWDNQGFGTTSWPACGEIDIMEHWGHNQNFVQSAMHTPSSFGNTENKGGQMIPTASSDFHVYTLEWSPIKMKFAVDGVVHYQYNPSNKNAQTWPFDAPQYLLLNIAIEPTISTSFARSEMVLDYVRVYQQDNASVSKVEKEATHLLYPNPASHSIAIAFANTSPEQIKFDIYNTMGQVVQTYTVVKSGNLATIKVIENLQVGTYFIRYVSEEMPYTLRFHKH